jgi:hypothetical protein
VLVGVALWQLVRAPRNIYAITAPIVVEAAERILEGRFNATGVVAAGEIFDAQDFLMSIRPDVSLD